MKLNIPDEILAEIGKIAVVNALIDDTLTELLGTLLPISSGASRCITAEMSHRQRAAAFSFLVIYAAGADHVLVQRWRGVVKLLNEAEQQRNTVLHSSWSVPDQPVRLKSAGQPFAT